MFKPARFLNHGISGVSTPNHQVGKAEALEMIKGLSLGRRHRRAEVGWGRLVGPGVFGGLTWDGTVG